MKRGPTRIGTSARSLVAATAVTVSNESSEQKIARAKEYPYARPSSSFLFVNGKAHTFEDSSWKGVQNLQDLVVTGEDNVTQRSGALLDLLGISHCAPADPGKWTQVLAIGSNASPQQLARKFPLDLFPEGYVIPIERKQECILHKAVSVCVQTIRGVLSDFDVAYAPLVSSYGSCTATLEHSPETACEVFVSFMNQPQMDRMNETEGAYNLCKLKNIVLDLGVSLETWRKVPRGVQKLNEVLQFNHQGGTLHMPVLDGQDSPVALREISAISRKFPDRSQIEMLQHLMHTFPCSEVDNGLPLVRALGASNEDDCLNSWILANLGDSKQRLKIVQLLMDRAKAFMYKDTEILVRLGNQFSENVE